jgi:hypothetical protein
MEVSNLLIGVFLIILGVVVKHFKLYFLIAGYNTMSEADKEKVDIERVATLLRNVMVFMGLALILLGLASSYMDTPEIADYLFFPIIIGGVIYLIVKSNSKAYKK